MDSYRNSKTGSSKLKLKLPSVKSTSKDIADDIKAIREALNSKPSFTNDKVKAKSTSKKANTSHSASRSGELVAKNGLKVEMDDNSCASTSQESHPEDSFLHSLLNTTTSSSTSTPNLNSASRTSSGGRPVRQRKPNQRYTDLMSEIEPSPRTRTTSYKSTPSADEELIQPPTKPEKSSAKSSKSKPGRKKSTDQQQPKRSYKKKHPVPEPTSALLAETSYDQDGGSTPPFDAPYSEYADFHKPQSPPVMQGEFEPPPEFDDELIPEPEPGPYLQLNDEVDGSEAFDDGPGPNFASPNNICEDVDSDASSPPFLPVSTMPLPSLSPAVVSDTPATYNNSSQVAPPLEPTPDSLTSTPLTILKSSELAASPFPAASNKLASVSAASKFFTNASTSPFVLDSTSISAPMLFDNVSSPTFFSSSAASQNVKVASDLNSAASSSAPTAAQNVAKLAGPSHTSSSLDFNELISRPPGQNDFQLGNVKDALFGQVEKSAAENVTFDFDNFALQGQKRKSGDSDYCFARSVEEKVAKKPQQRRPRVKKPANWLDEHQRLMQQETDEALQALKFTDERDELDDFTVIESARAWEADPLYVPEQEVRRKTQRKPPVKRQKRAPQETKRAPKRANQEIPIYNASDSDDFRFYYRPRPAPSFGSSDFGNFCFLPPEIAGDHCYGKSQPIVSLDLDEPTNLGEDEDCFEIRPCSTVTFDSGEGQSVSQVGHHDYLQNESSLPPPLLSSGYDLQQANALVDSHVTLRATLSSFDQSSSSSNDIRTYAAAAPPILEPMDSMSFHGYARSVPPSRNYQNMTNSINR